MRGMDMVATLTIVPDGDVRPTRPGLPPALVYAPFDLIVLVPDFKVHIVRVVR